MSLTSSQQAALDHLRKAYVGPEGGDEEVVWNPPNRRYAVGMLFPQEAIDRSESEHADDLDIEAEVETPGEVEERGAAVPVSEEWRPSSVAISFVTDRATAVCNLAGGTYEAVEGDGPPRWRRRPFFVEDLEMRRGRGPHQISVNGVGVEVGSRWRAYGSVYLATVFVRVREESSGDDRFDISKMLYQVALSVTLKDGGRFLEYDPARSFDVDDEAAELRLRYRDRKVYAVGHGMAADWTFEEDLCTRIWLDPVPSFVVPAVETLALEADTPEAGALELAHLAKLDANPDVVLASLEAFVDAFGLWVSEQDQRVVGFGADQNVARRIVDRSERAVTRMRESIALLRQPDQGHIRTSFALGMAAMRLQMRQSEMNQGGESGEPRWRPFQLGFLLVTLSSTIDETHADRKLVDLIWFPTGGGKTEAYLGLAAIEIFRRRLLYGVSGGGTAVITRYTLRLLTAQQFQRAASLVCAMELLRRPGEFGDARVRNMVPFSIGLWVGNEVTPGSRIEAKADLERLYKAARPEEANQFQVESCPWCGIALLPASRSEDRSKYGVRLVGRDVLVHCTSRDCHFSDELPVVVVDELIYEQPPTILLATVDKFARLQFNPDASRILGLGTTYRQPSMIIQDELHLLSGPLGTTVAVFDAVIQLLLSRGGSTPKIVASTATIRASDEQVKGLYGRKVALYPPSGLDGDRTFFSQPVSSGVGRLYVGLMPQALSQMSAVVAAAAPLLEIPEVLEADVDDTSTRDAYWTAVMYHNSLRELGRTGTLVVDDVNSRLRPRAERLGLSLRRVRADKVLELTSRRGPEELPNDLRALKRRADESDDAIDVVLSSNMLSVGIDIPRLALMLMVGQPRTTAEYIQATSRVGRGAVRGIVTTLFRSNRARDRSHFETFRGYHEALYRSVEPTSVTPWSLASRDRSLAGALVTLLRHTISSLTENAGASRMDLNDADLKAQIETLVSHFLAIVNDSDTSETANTDAAVWELLREWDNRAQRARLDGARLLYDRKGADDAALFKRFGQSGEGWLVADSMRSVEPGVAIDVREPFEE
ncbi:helicase-like protein [Branchiibius hedensis]|uniref:Helicase conserved C-terminal domain-containing protein n=1 Tax=Branchiibius hedensis TaxID=672460 RepID=A0A2Y8ZSL1_9MICO|nr:helicase-related protein [Branchiibius hedensis]PWJ26063.1 helicase-like protein [Branchiibius hedensis]SSA34875.1 Helicase conserved C-terminal domain-containing protein [Branchiibius hedensis]